MNTLLFRRFLKRPMQIASVVPSSRALINMVAGKFDFSKPGIIAEFGPGEGCHTRELVKRMHPQSRLLLFEVDPELSRHLEAQFADDPRIEVLNTDAINLSDALAERSLQHCDYILSGIPFSTMEIGKKRTLVQEAFDALSPRANSAFIVYQLTNELRKHATLFPHVATEYCLQSFPPMFVTLFFKLER